MIVIEKLIPDFLEKEKVEVSGIWNKQVTIPSAKKIHIVAPSGRGKTSLVHFLYGLRKDYSGNILFNNKGIKTFNASELSAYRQKQVSIIFQDLRLFPEHTCFENINVKRLLQPYHDSDSIYEMAEKLGVVSKLDKQLGKCSYGEQQRIAIIRSLQQPFNLLLMDEPFSNLDEDNRYKAMELIESESAKRQATILLFDLKLIDQYTPDDILYL